MLEFPRAREIIKEWLTELEDICDIETSVWQNFSYGVYFASKSLSHQAIFYYYYSGIAECFVTVDKKQSTTSYHRTEESLIRELQRYSSIIFGLVEETADS
jgi:hypothetical protein